MIIPTESQRRNPTKEHLHPRHDRHSLSDDSMSVDSHLADLPVEALRDVEFEVDAKDDLDNQHEHEPICEGGVDVVREGSAFVQVSEEVGGDCDEGSEDLKRDVPAVADYLFIVNMGDEEERFQVMCRLPQGPFL